MGLRQEAPFFWHLMVSLCVLALGSFLLHLAIRGWSPRERLWTWVAFAVHAVAAYALIFVIQQVYGIGDVVTFFRQGELIVRYVRIGGTGAISNLLALIFQREAEFPFLVVGIGSSTGTMSGIGAVLLLLTDSLWAGNLVAALAAFSGQLAIYATLRRWLPVELHPRALVASLLLPSVVFWSGGLVKEALTVCGLGWLLLGLTRASARAWKSAVPLVLLGALLIGLSKPYVFMPLLLSLGLWLYWRKAVAERGSSFVVKPIWLAIAALAATLGTGALGAIFPEYAVDNLGEQLAMHQFYGTRAGGGSYFQPGETSGRSLPAQLALAPVALLSAWFRPLALEVNNAAMASNAIESTLFLVYAIRVLFLNGFTGTWRRLRASPTLMFCLAFAALMGIGIGIASTNMGSLSRYRIPLMPFLAFLLLALERRVRATTSRKSASQRLATRPTS